jgi:NAD(P)H-binding
MTSRLAVTAAWVGALLFTLGGVWALFAPHLFFAVIATYPPYNRHLFHDVGAFQLGIAAALAAGIAVAGRSPSDCGAARWAGRRTPRRTGSTRIWGALHGSGAGHVGGACAGRRPGGRRGAAMRTFLAGASGVIGRRLTPRLVQAGHEVSAMTRSPEKVEALAATGATPVVCDVFNAERLRDAVTASRPDVGVQLLTDLPADLNPRNVERAYAANDRVRDMGSANPVAAEGVSSTMSRVIPSPRCHRTACDFVFGPTARPDEGRRKWACSWREAAGAIRRRGAPASAARGRCSFEATAPRSSSSVEGERTVAPRRWSALHGR